MAPFSQRAEVRPGFRRERVKRGGQSWVGEPASILNVSRRPRGFRHGVSGSTGAPAEVPPSRPALLRLTMTSDVDNRRRGKGDDARRKGGRASGLPPKRSEVCLRRNTQGGMGGRCVVLGLARAVGESQGMMHGRLRRGPGGGQALSDSARPLPGPSMGGRLLPALLAECV